MSMTLCLHDGACPLRNSGREQPCAIGNTRGAVRNELPRACVYAVSYATDVSVPRTRDGAAQHIAILPHMPHVRSMPESARLHVDSTQPVNIILENAR
jgi:hypothetical protein